MGLEVLRVLAVNGYSFQFTMCQSFIKINYIEKYLYYALKIGILIIEKLKIPILEWLLLL